MPASSNRGAEIYLDGVTKRYPTSLALDDITLHVRAGEFLTLLGPSGSGKTTLLNLIAGFIELTAGSIHLDGRRINDVPVHKRGLGIVFQHYALFPHLTVSDNIAFPLTRRKMPKEQIRELVNAELATAGLSGYGKRFPRELSGGQQQRVALARALVFKPEVLLLDEPLGALDKNLRERLQLEIRRIHREVGRTFVFVTHDQEEALTLSDRIAVFNEGRIEQVGTAQELYERPVSLFVAEFIGESTVVPETTGDMAWVIRPEKAKLLEPHSEVPGGCLTADVMIQQSVYLGSGWKHEIVLPDNTTGVVRSDRIPDSLHGVNIPAQLTWHPSEVTRVSAPKRT
ncbi:MAG: polyamine ABC transporter ATP-binding protein [Candidatus Lumbricidophila eiseniae]|uniref:ABC-type quaternary amine transporter n=1 Tax=Candidatus Lumbricidiphila eiseniae TaxID=1969409 RepID=A0A2A6FPL7_9MICO|nr:MAG: polyamine ABC transporter ATP-binding protein [Candidatus Lumbricidophila eiseniae]